ncbi:hypothetical protein HPB48_020502 [Haemaphysalis longicornis]|uniref:Uncharacterized protein n=1 Tax=Haemaphysalis longicornis TaxID=44386 RepID=A0A9J6GLF5_HAELO|nr:hypothetical protein HPB48_020502 [Haemaphysalis longicornis]
MHYFTYIYIFITGLRQASGISLKLGCSVEVLDKCGADLVIFGTGNRVPNTTEGLLAQCEVEFSAGVCARQFANRCLPPLPRGMVVVILEGISQEVASKCNVSNPLHNGEWKRESGLFSNSAKFRMSCL